METMLEPPPTELELPPELRDLPNTPEFNDFWAHCPFRWQGDHGAMVWLDRLYNWQQAAPPIRPTLQLVNPTNAAQGASVTLDLIGQNFVTGAVCVFSGVEIPATFMTAQRLSVSIASLNAAVGPAPVAVRNPDGMISGNQTFTVNAP